MASGFYLGKEVDPAAGTLGSRIELDPADLLTHGLIVGMTGSGKTGLAIALIEEALRQQVPVLAIDPKGDLGNLLLLFDDLAPASFAPWIDPDAARREGRTVDGAAAEVAGAWRKGLADWGLSAADVASLRAGHEAVVYTPGSNAGVSLNVLQSLEAPAVPFESAEEDLRDEIQGIVAGLLGLLGIEADPLKSREYILLANLIEAKWRAGAGLELEDLIAGVGEPPFEKLGALPLESVYPRRERHGLMMALNNLLASPSFEAWREGEPLDVERMLRGRDGRPRLSIVYTSHLADQERLFVTALLLDKVKTWMRRLPGTSELRALVYMDEVFGYFPPHPANPPTKRPLLTLLKQARAQGVGVVLATQNPVDLDYKGLANMGTWLVGTLQTQQDRDRLREGLLGSGVAAAALDRLLDATRKRVFLLHDVHRPGPCLLHSRWALSYLRGPLTRDEVARLTESRAVESPPAPAAPMPSATAPSAGAPPAQTAPVAPAPFRHNYHAAGRGGSATAHLLVKYAVRYKGAGELVAVRAYPLAAGSAAEVLEGGPLELSEAAVATAAPAGLRYGDLPPWLTPAAVKALEKTLKDRLPDKLAVKAFVDPVTKACSEPGERREDFAGRLRSGTGGPQGEKLRDKLDKKKRELAAREQELTGRKAEKWASLGGTLLSSLPGLLTGRKRSVSGVGSILSKSRMQNAAESRVETLRAEIAELEKDLASLVAVDPSRFEETTLLPVRSGVSILRYDLLWVY